MLKSVQNGPGKIRLKVMNNIFTSCRDKVFVYFGILYLIILIIFSKIVAWVFGGG